MQSLRLIFVQLCLILSLVHVSAIDKIDTKAKDLNLTGTDVTKLEKKFPDLLYLTLDKAKKLKSLDGKYFPKLQVLSCAGSRLEKITGTWESVEEVYADKSKISTFDAKMPKLHNLILSDNKLDKFKCDYETLLSLDLSKNELNSRSFSGACKNLQDVDISYNKLDALNNDHAKVFGPNVSTINANENGILSWSGSWNSLYAAELNHNKIQGVTAIIPSMVLLELANNRITFDGFRPQPSVENSIALTNLTKFVIANQTLQKDTLPFYSGLDIQMTSSLIQYLDVQNANLKMNETLIAMNMTSQIKLADGELKNLTDEKDAFYTGGNHIGIKGTTFEYLLEDQIIKT